MLKTRIIPVLLSRNGSLVKGRRFKSDRVVGHVLQAARVHEMRGVDELMVLDVAATPEKRAPDFKLVKELTDGCFMPLTVGGGIRWVDDISQLMDSGADKVVVGTQAAKHPEIITQAAERFGSQAIAVSIDVRLGTVWTHCGTQDASFNPVEWARHVEMRGAGEIILNAIDRDGTMEGYDLNLIDAVSKAVSIPVVASGGCSSYEDIELVLSATEAHAVAVGALLQFSDATPRGAAQHLSERGYQVRVGA